VKRICRLAALSAAASLAVHAWVDREEGWYAKRRNFWAFQAPARAEVPPSSHKWVRTPVDAFILEALKAKGLAPSAELERAALIRRLSLDLTGMPPSPEEVEAFVNDRAPDAYEKLVDRLMASPQYAERWALKWLDVVRYADTNGFELDAERPQAWRYRDYVIRAFQNNKPYDRFVLEQLAGDELFPESAEAKIATGFLRAGPRHVVGGNQDLEMNRQEDLIEMTAVIGGGLLGLTVNCARCHDHKFDPIAQADYYRLQAALASTEFEETELASPEELARYEEAKKTWEARMKPVKDAIAEIEKPYRERLKKERREKLAPEFLAALDIPKEKRTEEQQRLAEEAGAQIKVSWDDVVAVLTPADKARRAQLRRQMHALEYEEPEPPRRAFGVVTAPKAPLTFLLKVGDHNKKQEVIEPGYLHVISPGGGGMPRGPEGRRSALAKWIASPEHPLTARVMVNRIWQLRMGTGLVATPNDFGLLGARPSNQKLLDWLAVEFVERGWDIRAIDRMIVTSSAYRQAAANDEAKAKLDPDNKLYWRMNRRRLDAELIRDSALKVSGALNPELFGKPVKIPIEPEVYDLIFTEGEPDNLWPVDLDRTQHFRRSMYLLNKRTVRLPLLANFDQPDAMSPCPERAQSTHALQALSLLNSDIMREQARLFAARLKREGGDEVARAYHLALARAPRQEEVEMARKFFRTGGLLEDFCLALLNRSEFVYVP
jgi:hypothetical protein